jgi:cell division protein FtsZ
VHHQMRPAPAMEAPVHQPQPVVTAGDVTLQPVPAKPALFREAAVELDAPRLPPREEPLQAREFIPPAAERPARPVRMPSVDDLPRPGQQQMRAAQIAPPAPAPAPAPVMPADNPVERKRTSLMEKLAAIGFTRRAEEPEAAAPRTAPPLAPARPAPQAQRPAAPAPQIRREPAGLDIHGRPAQPQQRAEEDHLDIPAFLRRQAN